MIGNYFTIAYRNLLRNKAFSFINIFGLALGLACSMLILLWVQDELNWDRFHPNIDKLYRVYLNRPGDNGVFTQSVVQLPLWDELKATAGVAHVSPVKNLQITLAHDDARIETKAFIVGDEFLKMFRFTFTEGLESNALNDPSSIVLTKTTARALFGTEMALGKVIRIDNKADWKVSAVIDGPPQNSTLQFEALIPFNAAATLLPYLKHDLTYWENSSSEMYLEADPNTDASVLQSRVRDLTKPHTINKDDEILLFPLHRSRLYSEFENGVSVGGAITYVRIFSIAAFVILALACINFINLATARSGKRAKEVGIRKTVGSGRKQLVLQFLSETVLMALLSFMLAIVLVEVFLPSFNVLINKALSVHYEQSAFWKLAGVFILITGVVAGSYPAFFLSSFNPIAVLKGKPAPGKQGALPRRIMVTLQFFFSIALLIGTAVIYNQISFIKDRTTGYNKNNLLMVPATGDMMKNYAIIRDKLLQKSLATAVTASSTNVTVIPAWSKPDWDGRRDDQNDYFALISIGHDYIGTVGVTLLQGRSFDDEFNDSTSVILNRTAADQMELETPLGTRVRVNGGEFTVVGIMDDMVMGSPYHPAAPTIFLFKPSWMDNVLIRLPENSSTVATMNGIGDVFSEYNPAFPFTFQFADQSFGEKFVNEERIRKLANLFAILASVISGLGLLGLSAYAAEQRTKEVGIRKVMGASTAGIVTLFSKDFTRPVIVAFVCAAPVSWWIMERWLQQFTYRVAVGWWVILSAGAAALLLTWTIVGLQAAKAARANPVKSIRSE